MSINDNECKGYVMFKKMLNLKFTILTLDVTVTILVVDFFITKTDEKIK